MSTEAVRRWALFLALVLWGLGYIAVFAWLLHDSRDFITAARVEAVCSAPPELAALSQSFNSIEAAATRNMLAAGWTSPEGWGVWSAEKRAVLVLPVPASFRHHPATLQLQVFAPINELMPQATVHVDLVGRPTAQWRFGGDSQDRVRRIEFAAGELDAKHCIEIRFRFEQAFRPLKLGSGPDRRLLGMGLERISWIESPASAPIR